MAEGSSGSVMACGICFETDVHDWGGLSGCSHSFCWPCTKQWVTMDSRCPLCKVEVTRVTKMVLSSDGGSLGVASPLEEVAVPPCRQVCDEEGDNPFDVDADAIVCDICGEGTDEHILMICDGCQRGFHTRCVGLAEVPEDDYYCHDCAPVAVAVVAPPPLPVPAAGAPSSAPQEEPENETLSVEDKSESPEEEPIPVRRSTRAAGGSSRRSPGRRGDVRRSPQEDSIASRTRLATSRNRGVASRTRQATRLAEDATRVRNSPMARRDRPISEGLHRRSRARINAARRRILTSDDTEPSTNQEVEENSEDQEVASSRGVPRQASPEEAAQPEIINLVSTDDTESPETSETNPGSSSIKISDLRRQFEVTRDPEEPPRGSRAADIQGSTRSPAPPARPGPQRWLSGLARNPQRAADEGLFGSEDRERDLLDRIHPLFRPDASEPPEEGTNELGVKCLAEGRILSKKEEELKRRTAAMRSCAEDAQVKSVEDLWALACGQTAYYNNSFDNRVSRARNPPVRRKRSREGEESEGEEPRGSAKHRRQADRPSQDPPRRPSRPSRDPRLARPSQDPRLASAARDPPAGAGSSARDPPPGPSSAARDPPAGPSGLVRQRPGVRHTHDSYETRLLRQDLQVLMMSIETGVAEFLQAVDKHPLYTEVHKELSEKVFEQLEMEMLRGATLEAAASPSNIDSAVAEFSGPFLAKLI